MWGEGEEKSSIGKAEMMKFEFTGNRKLADSSFLLFDVLQKFASDGLVALLFSSYEDFPPKTGQV